MQEPATLQVCNTNTIQNTSNLVDIVYPNETIEEISICGECSEQFATVDECEKHMESHTYKCYKCDIKFNTEEQLKAHEVEHHDISTRTEDCQDKNCKKNVHEDKTLMSEMFDQVREGIEKMEIMRNMLLQLLQGQNEMKQELFVIRNKQETIPIQQSSVKSPMKKSYAEVASTPILCSVSNKSPRVPQPQPLTQLPPQQYSPPRTPQVPQNQIESSRILFVGDSVSANINLEAIENATGKELVCKKAYTAVQDTTENVAKKAAFFPKSNFTDVVPDLLKKSKYHSLLIQSGSVDISNLLTKDNTTEYIEYFKQETILSAKNTYAVGVNALHVQPSLEKVVIMKQTPRYDPAESDPLLLKPALSQLFNNTLTEQWIDCPFKDRIMIGAQHQVYWRYKGIPV